MREVQTVAAKAASHRVDVPAEAREVCLGATLPRRPNPDERDYQVFGVLQTGMLEICDRKRALSVAASDYFNRQQDRFQEMIAPPRSLWQRLTGRHPKNVAIPDLNDAEVANAPN